MASLRFSAFTLLALGLAALGIAQLLPWAAHAGEGGGSSEGISASGLDVAVTPWQIRFRADSGSATEGWYGSDASAERGASFIHSGLPLLVAGLAAGVAAAACLRAGAREAALALAGVSLLEMAVAVGLLATGMDRFLDSNHAGYNWQGGFYLAILGLGLTAGGAWRAFRDRAALPAAA